jgi:HD-GYP domain-containing protein (c-di-GMP phosphodiesterase class II)
MSDAEALILDVIEELGPRASIDTGPAPTASEDAGPGVLESLMDGIGGLFRKRERFRSPQRGAAPPETRPKAVDSAPRIPVHHEFIPHSIPVTFHPETRRIDEEMPQARQAFAQAEALSRQLIEDIRAGRLFSVEELDQVIDDVVDSALRSPDALMLVTRLKHQDVTTYGHSLQVSVYLVALGRHLGLPKEDLARLATLGLFLDLGKTKVPNELLSRPGPLSPEEFGVVKQHVSHGMGLISRIPDLHPSILEGIAQHHEREDGSGYPGGLRAEGISLYGRMAGIVDTFVAMTTPRPHAAAITAYDALRKISELGGRLFHAPLVEQFVQTVGVFPVGSRVELSSGEVAIVLQQSTVRRLKPKVLVVAGPDKVPLQVPATLDLLYQGAGEESVHIARGLPAGSYGQK